MIVSDIRSLEQERHLLPAAVQRGLDYVLKQELAQSAPGKYELEGDLMFALVQEVVTRPLAEQKPESHAVYTDIQLLVSGEERLGVSRKDPGFRPVDDQFEARDIAFYDKAQSPRESEIVLQPGMFTVFFPSDIHRPCCSVSVDGPIKKVVVKIHRQLLE